MERLFQGARSGFEYLLALFFCIFWPIIAAECYYLARREGDPDKGQFHTFFVGGLFLIFLICLTSLGVFSQGSRLVVFFLGALGVTYILSGVLLVKFIIKKRKGGTAKFLSV